MPAPEHLHPWVAEADRESKAFKANPDRPRVWVKDGSSTKRIQDCVPDSLQRGDVVAVSFTVTYHLTATNWFPQFHPAEIVVLQATTGDATDYSAPALGLHTLPPPSFYVGDESDGKRASWCAWVPVYTDGVVSTARTISWIGPGIGGYGGRHFPWTGEQDP